MAEIVIQNTDGTSTFIPDGSANRVVTTDGSGSYSWEVPNLTFQRSPIGISTTALRNEILEVFATGITVSAPASPALGDTFGVDIAETAAGTNTISGNGNAIEDPSQFGFAPGSITIGSATAGSSGLAFMWAYNGSTWRLIGGSNGLTRNYRVNNTIDFDTGRPLVVAGVIDGESGLQVENLQNRISIYNDQMTFAIDGGLPMKYIHDTPTTGQHDFYTSTTLLASIGGNGNILYPRGVGAGETGNLSFRGLAGTNAVTIKSPDTVTTSYTLTWPAAGPAGSGAYLAATTAGILSWDENWQTYTPTYTSISNLGSTATHLIARYRRRGVHVEFLIQANIAASGGGNAFKDMRVSLPIASSFTATTQASGTVSWVSSSFNGGALTAHTANDELHVTVHCGNEGSALTMTLQGVYEVL